METNKSQFSKIIQFAPRVYILNGTVDHFGCLKAVTSIYSKQNNTDQPYVKTNNLILFLKQITNDSVTELAYFTGGVVATSCKMAVG